MAVGSLLVRSYKILFASVLLSGCGFDAAVPAGGGIAQPDANPNIPDADPNAPDANRCTWTFTPQFFDPCEVAAFAAPLTLPAADEPYVYDTTTGKLNLPDSEAEDTPLSTVERGMRVVWLQGLTIEVGAALRVRGMYPLLIVAQDSIVVAGALGVGSFYSEDGYRQGAGANPAECLAAGPGLKCLNHGGSGGGGGGLGGNGGPGGEGGDTHNCDAGDGKPGGVGGASVPTPDHLRGGCPGASSVAPEPGDVPQGGPGGGALMLSARVKIAITGTVNAGGAGGEGCTDGNRAGGGGGGSGGMLAFEAGLIELTGAGAISANGGGGGGGCDHEFGQRGADALLGGGQASGGAGEGDGAKGGAGGDGGYSSQLQGGPGTLHDRGGGGGGGGGGFVIFYTDALQLGESFSISPNPS